MTARPAGTARKDPKGESATPPAETGAALDPPVFTFFNEMGIIQQLARAEFERMLPGGMHMSHFSVLNHFVRLGGVSSPARLASAFQVTRGAMTNTLGWLERNGLVAITPDPADGRAKIVRITPAGRRMRAKAVERLAVAATRLEAEFDAEDFTAQIPFLQKLRAFLDENRGRLAAPDS